MSLESSSLWYFGILLLLSAYTQCLYSSTWRSYIYKSELLRKWRWPSNHFIQVRKSAKPNTKRFSGKLCPRLVFVQC